ncbi:hypothetical protein BSL78_05575 [Apostichopus japonicus]|uniref:Integrase catalytic domain-containing protein n=1 Tax=Stichopus japonicus TaxID=307972 RepID=A0A2G8LB91_STIJA|nr:hypothetical protein BSL78_05575 [Apostichopus japonicus]
MYALPDQTAETVAQCLFDKYFCEHGISEVLHTDQGKQFESKLVHRLCKLMGIVKTRTSPYHPQSDGQVERFNRTLKSELSKRLFSTGNQWDKMLNHIAFSYNTSVHSSIGYSPFFLVNGREARMPLEVMFGDTPVGYSCHSSYGDFVDDITKRMKEASKIVGQELVKAQEKQADYVELKTRFLPYVVGDLVWVNDPAKQRDKLAARWKGPHRVIRVMNNGVTYQLQDLSKSSIPSKVIHYNRLKPYVSPYSLEDVNEKLIQPNPPSVVQGNYLPNLSLDEFYRNLPFHFESNLDTSGISPELQGGKRLDNKRLTRLGREAFPVSRPEEIIEVVVWKRYNDFKKLHKALSAVYFNLRRPGKFPEFAKSKIFGRFEESVIEERRQSALELLEFTSRVPILAKCVHMLEFFQVGF